MKDCYSGERMPRAKKEQEQKPATVFEPPQPVTPTPAPATTNDKNRRITKIKYSPGHVLIKYQVVRDGKEPDEIVFPCSEEPVPELPAKLQELKAHVADMLELGCPDCRDEQLDALRVGSVSIDYKKAKDAAESTSGPRMIMGVVISAWKTVQDGAQGANLNTPHRPEEPYVGAESAEPGASDMCLAPSCARIIGELVELAERYLQGERLQPKLPGLDGKSLAAGEKEE